jgi:hypothetical protein
VKITRRRVLSLTGAIAALAMPVTALAAEPAETFTLVRAGSTTVIYDANDTNVYIRAGSTEIMEPGSAARLGALLTAVRKHPEPGVFEFRLPAEKG